jgi:uncharacterized protein DUF4387
VELWEAATLIRSKNAGPFAVTFDILFADDCAFARAVGSGALKAESVARLYGVEASLVEVYERPRIRAVKVTVPRPCSAGDINDDDVFGGQMHGPLVRLPI